MLIEVISLVDNLTVFVNTGGRGMSIKYLIHLTHVIYSSGPHQPAAIEPCNFIKHLLTMYTHTHIIYIYIYILLFLFHIHLVKVKTFLKRRNGAIANWIPNGTHVILNNFRTRYLSLNICYQTVAVQIRLRRNVTGPIHYCKYFTLPICNLDKWKQPLFFRTLMYFDFKLNSNVWFCLCVHYITGSILSKFLCRYTLHKSDVCVCVFQAYLSL